MVKLILSIIICYGIYSISPEAYTSMVGWVIDVSGSAGMDGAIRVLSQPSSFGGYGLSETVATVVYFAIPVAIIWISLLVLFIVL